MKLPPVVEDCLFRLRPSTQKGGTLICEEVTDLDAHKKRICDPDAYRPKSCRCGWGRLHVHDYRDRTPRTESGKLPPVDIMRFRCERCGARWQILPLFLARHLWRTWGVVARALMTQPSPPEPEPTSPEPQPSLPEPQPEKARKPQGRIPERTLRRWQNRWLRPALRLAQVLVVTGQTAWGEFAAGLPGNASCADLVDAYGRQHGVGQPMAELAALFHRFQPNVRLL